MAGEGAINCALAVQTANRMSAAPSSRGNERILFTRFCKLTVSHAAVAASVAAIVFLYYIRPDCPTLFLDRTLKDSGAAVVR